MLIALSYHVRFASADAFETSLSFSSSLWQDRLLIMKKKVLFICVHNSAWSQMAEAFLNNICGDHFEAHSAGLEPGRLNPLAVEAMRAIGIDISHKQTQSVLDVFESAELFAYVITVCDESSAERCPIFPVVANRLHWSFPDPAALSGTHEECLAGTRKIRDQIRARIEMWCDKMCPVETTEPEQRLKKAKHRGLIRTHHSEIRFHPRNPRLIS